MSTSRSWDELLQQRSLNLQAINTATTRRISNTRIPITFPAFDFSFGSMTSGSSDVGFIGSTAGLVGYVGAIGSTIIVGRGAVELVAEG